MSYCGSIRGGGEISEGYSYLKYGCKGAGGDWLGDRKINQLIKEKMNMGVKKQGGDFPLK